MTGAAVLWCAYLAAAAAGVWPARRAPGAALLALAAGCLVLAVLEGAAPRSLDVVHSHTAFVGNQVELKDFVLETREAPGWHWAAVAGLFCALLGAGALAGLPRSGAFAWPLLFAWSGTALVLALEKLAAPAEAIAFRLPAGNWLAGIVAAVGLARGRPGLVAYALTLLLLATALWAPTAIFGALATTNGWGTSLDVHAIEFCAHPLARTPLTLEPGSLEQLWYLVWAPYLVVYPLLTWLSAGGFGFLVLMAQRERRLAPS